jgi:hypothetical protein
MRSVESLLEPDGVAGRTGRPARRGACAARRQLRPVVHIVNRSQKRAEGLRDSGGRLFEPGCLGFMWCSSACDTAHPFQTSYPGKRARH